MKDLATCKRTKMDILLLAIRESVGPESARVFVRDILPQFHFGPEAFRPLTEEEYQKLLRELPYFLKSLRDKFRLGNLCTTTILRSNYD